MQDSQDDDELVQIVYEDAARSTLPLPPLVRAVQGRTFEPCLRRQNTCNCLQ